METKLKKIIAALTELLPLPTTDNTILEQATEQATRLCMIQTGFIVHWFQNIHEAGN